MIARERATLVADLPHPMTASEAVPGLCGICLGEESDPRHDQSPLRETAAEGLRREIGS